MAIIQHGSMSNFSAIASAEAQAKFPSVRGVRTFASLPQVVRAAQPLSVEFQTSGSARGLALKSIKLTQGFEGFVGNLFNTTNDLYFFAWAWDFSGQSPLEYPDPSTISPATPRMCLIPLKVGNVREFLGAGVVLFPARKVTAGLALRMMLWAAHQNKRDFGNTLIEVGNAIQGSELTTLLTTFATTAGATAAIIPAATAATAKLAQTIGAILKGKSDDYVDFYEGYYPAVDPWTAGDETHAGHASEISLTRLS